MRGLLNNFVNICPSNEVVRPVPHRKPGGWVIEEDPLVASPDNTPRNWFKYHCFTLRNTFYSQVFHCRPVQRDGGGVGEGYAHVTESYLENQTWLLGEES